MSSNTQPEVWSVSALNRATRELLEQAFGTVWVEAEVSNLARPASGHIYFSLKDGGAQLRAAFFRQRQRGSVRDLAEGDQVLVRGRLSLYEPRGDYQLIVEHLEPAGEGALRREFERLKRKLLAEGLFDDGRKQPLPTLPRRIGVITSPSGAAVRDILKVLGRRMPAVPVLVYGASVQGRDAPQTLRRALALAIARRDCDVLILARGGGSLEDLAAFNDEGLARDIADCPIPVVTGVGHEVDFTIADFVADARAPTPSSAAEMAVPDRATLIANLETTRRRLVRAVERTMERPTQRLDRAARRLQAQNPARQLAEQRRRLDRLRRDLVRAAGDALGERRRRCDALTARLRVQTPTRALRRRSELLSGLARRLVRAQRAQQRQHRQRLGSIVQTLHAVSPLATVARGYAVVRAPAGQAITHVRDLDVDADVDVQLRDGSFAARVTGVSPDDDG